MFYYVAHFYNLNVLGPRRDEGGRDDGATGERPEERQQPGELQPEAPAEPAVLPVPVHQGGADPELGTELQLLHLAHRALG